jgi:hypothetical protein
MKRVLRKQRSVYGFSLFLIMAGVAALAAVLWKTYPKLSMSQNPLSTFLSLLWEESINVADTVAFRLVYLVIFGDVALVLGFILWLLSRQWLTVPGKFVWYECPFCKKGGRLSETKPSCTAHIVGNWCTQKSWKAKDVCRSRQVMSINATYLLDIRESLSDKFK